MSDHRSPEALRLAVDLYAARARDGFVTEAARTDALLATADRFSDWLPEQSPESGGIGSIIAELAAIRAQLDRIESIEGDLAMSQQDIDTATTELTEAVADVAGQITQLGTDFTAIQAEITSLQGSGVDTTALDAAVAAAQSTLSGLDPAVAQVTSLAPAVPPVPPSA